MLSKNEDPFSIVLFDLKDDVMELINEGNNSEEREGENNPPSQLEEMSLESNETIVMNLDDILSQLKSLLKNEKPKDSSLKPELSEEANEEDTPSEESSDEAPERDKDEEIHLDDVLNTLNSAEKKQTY